MAEIRPSHIKAVANAARRGQHVETGNGIEDVAAGVVELQEITAAAAITLPSYRVKHVKITGPSSSTYAVTLAAPSVAGQVLIIEMVGTTATNAVTLALTNVQGGSAASSASFNAANETLTLISGSAKWNVIAEAGVTLS